MNHKRTLLIVFLSHVAFIGLLWAFIPMVSTNSPASIIIASLSAAACILWSTLKISPLQPRGDFQQNVLVSLAFADLIMLVGTFMGSNLPQGLFAGVSWCLMFVFILPKVLAA